MSTRERWIVYPLLFLALGAALRDKYIRPSRLQAARVEAEEMVVHQQLLVNDARCRNVAVIDSVGAERARLSATPSDTGQLALFGKDGSPVLAAGADDSGRSGLVEVAGPGAARCVQLRSTEDGGLVATFDKDQKTILWMGHQGGDAGVFVQLPESRAIARLTRAFERPEPKDVPGDDPEP